MRNLLDNIIDLLWSILQSSNSWRAALCLIEIAILLLAASIWAAMYKAQVLMRDSCPWTKGRCGFSLQHFADFPCSIFEMFPAAFCKSPCTILQISLHQFAERLRVPVNLGLTACFLKIAQANGAAQEAVGEGQQEPEGADEMGSSRLRTRQGPLQAPRPTVAPASEPTGADLSCTSTSLLLERLSSI